MNSFAISIVIGFFIGCVFGVGCALAVIYSIYIGGYRKAMEDSLRPEKSERYLQMLPKVQSSFTHQEAAPTKEFQEQ
jgi:hypothetical protein